MNYLVSKDKEKRFLIGLLIFLLIIMFWGDFKSKEKINYLYNCADVAAQDAEKQSFLEKEFNFYSNFSIRLDGCLNKITPPQNE